MEKCRFLSEKGICQIGQLALHNLENEGCVIAELTGDVDKPNMANANPAFITDKDSGRDVLIFVMDCTVIKDIAKQQLCDSFLPNKKITRTKWLENFSEG